MEELCITRYDLRSWFCNTWFLQEYIETEPVAAGHEPMPSADVVSKVSSQTTYDTSLKNAGTKKTRTSRRRRLQLMRSLAPHEEVDKLKRITENIRREMEEHQEGLQDNYNELCELFHLYTGNS